MSEEPGESKTPFGDIHRSDYNQEAQMAYDETTDDDSSLGSSPYQSDKEIIESLFAHGNESTSSSDDQETLHADFPSKAIDIEESRLILDQTALMRATDPDHRIFPQSAKTYLELLVTRSKVITEEISNQAVERKSTFYQRDLKRATDPGHTIFPHSAKTNLELSLQNPGDDVDVISREIQNVLYQHDGWAYVAHQMAHIGKFQCRKLPNMSICDVAIIRATQPLHILTFVEDGGKQEHAVEYNAQLTRNIMGFIKEETGVSLDVVYGVVPASTLKDEKLFKEKLERLETVARRKALPGYLHMDTERYTAITKALVDLYSEPRVKVKLQPQEDPPIPVLGKAKPEASQTDTMQQGEDHGGRYSRSQFPQPSDRSLPTQGRNPRQTGCLKTVGFHWDAGDTFYPESPEGSELHTMQEDEPLRKKCLEHRYDKERKLIRAKIFIFGPTGSGKSSFCNGLRSALKDSDTPSNYYSVRNLGLSQTSRFQPSQYGDHWIIDMPGIFESSHFKTASIDAIVSSMVRFDAKITQSLDVKGDLPQHKERRDVSCVVLVLHHGITLGDELKRQIDAVIRGYGALSNHLVLTHLDECDPQFKDPDNLPNLYTSPLVQEAVKKMSEQTGIPGSNISYVKNYVTETETDPNTKLLHLRALDKILSSTADQVEKMIDNKLQKNINVTGERVDWGLSVLIGVVGALLLGAVHVHMHNS